MDFWVYIVIAVAYLIFSAFTNAKKASNPDAEGKNSNPEEFPEGNVIHRDGEKNPRNLNPENERQSGQNKPRSLEGMTLEEFMNAKTQQNKPKPKKDTRSQEDKTVEEFLKARTQKREAATEKREKKARSLEKKSREDETSYQNEIKKTAYQKTQESHYSEEDLVKQFEQKHKEGKTLEHHLHGTASKAFDYEKKKSTKSHLRRLIKHNDDLRRSYVVSLLLERKFDNEWNDEGGK